MAASVWRKRWNSPSVPCSNVAVFGGDDAGGDGVFELEGFADGEDPVTDFDALGVAHFHGGQGAVGLDLQDCDVGGFIDADDFGGAALVAFGIAGETDIDAVGLVDDVVVGDDVAAGIDDEAGAEGFAFLAVIAAVHAGVLAEEMVEEILETTLAALAARTGLTTLTALGTLIVVVAVWRLLLLGRGPGLHVMGAAAAILLLLLGEDFGIDVDDGGTDFFGDASEVGGKLPGGGDFERRGVRAVDLRFLTANLVGDDGTDQDSR